MTNLISLERGSVSGDSPDLVLFIPGLGGHPDQWSLVTPDLQAAGIDIGYAARVSASARHDADENGVVATSRALTDEVKALGYPHVHIVAHSLGCFVALEMLSISPDGFQDVLLVNGGLTTVGRFLERPLVTLRAETRHCLFASYLFLLVGLPVPPAVRSLVIGSRVLASVLLGRLVGQRALERANVRALLASNGGHPDVFVGLWRNRKEWSHFLEIAPELKGNVRMLAGRLDGLARMQDSEELARLVPGGSLRFLPDVGHVAPLEAPREIATEILSMLESR